MPTSLGSHPCRYSRIDVLPANIWDKPTPNNESTVDFRKLTYLSMQVF